MKKKFLTLISLLMVSVMLFAACSPTKPAEDQKTEVADDKSGEVKEETKEEPKEEPKEEKKRLKMKLN